MAGCLDSKGKSKMSKIAEKLNLHKPATGACLCHHNIFIIKFKELKNG